MDGERVRVPFTAPLHIMTRINSAIHPTELPSKLLLAEHREIKRIPSCVAKGRFNLKSTPSEFTLGTGHVAFFYNKLKYLEDRYKALHKECKERGFNVSWYGENWTEAFSKHPELFNNWEETHNSRELIIERIESKGFSLKSKSQ